MGMQMHTRAHDRERVSPAANKANPPFFTGTSALQPPLRPKCRDNRTGRDITVMYIYKGPVPAKMVTKICA